MDNRKRNATLTAITAIDPLAPEIETIHAAALTIRSGGIVIFPTRCLYGLGADAFNTDAVARVFTIKRRPASNPVLLLIPDPSALKDLVRSVPPAAELLIRAFWPGKITIIMDAKATVPRRLTAATGKIGVRMPGHSVAAALVRATGRPITGTSANFSGHPACSRISQMPDSLLSATDMVLDAGSLQGGIGSTVVDVTEEKVRIIREGVLPQSEIDKILPKTR